MPGVSARDGSSNGYNWTACYDGFGRRIETVEQSIVSGANSGSATTTISQYDPQVEFLEVGMSVNGDQTWKVYGPDVSGAYGGAQGTGGLEATVHVADSKVTAMVNDLFGNCIATIDGSSNAVTWNASRFGGYGPLATSSPQAALTTSNTVASTTGWRGRRIDPTGFFYMGARYYEPDSGRFLSPDPLGHASSMDLYSYCNGDPVNHVDPDGRCSTNNPAFSGDGGGSNVTGTWSGNPNTGGSNTNGSYQIGSYQIGGATVTYGSDSRSGFISA